MAGETLTLQQEQAKRGFEILNSVHPIETYQNDHARTVADSFNRTFNWIMGMVNLPQGVAKVVAIPVASSELLALTDATVSADGRALKPNPDGSIPALTGITENPDVRGAMVTLITADIYKNDNSGIVRIPIGVRNIVSLPAGADEITKPAFKVNERGKSRSIRYADIIGGSNVLVGGWTFAFDGTASVNRDLSSFDSEQLLPEIALRGKLRLGEAITHATVAAFKSLRTAGAYNPKTSTMIEQLGLLGSAVASLNAQNGQLPTDMGLGQILGIDDKMDIWDLLLSEGGSDIAVRTKMRVLRTLEVLGIKFKDADPRFMYNITPLIGEGHPAAKRAAINAQALGMSRLADAGSSGSAGPVFIGKLGDVN